MDKYKNLIVVLMLLFSVLFEPKALLGQQDRFIRLVGHVQFKGKGLKGVSVSDGRQVVYTDEKGRFDMLSDTLTDFVFISTPSGYEISMLHEKNRFYHRIGNKKVKKQLFNFDLEKIKNDDTKHSLIVGADPQVGYEEEMPLLLAALDDMKNHVRIISNNKSVYGMVCGDLVEKITQSKPSISAITQVFEDVGIPFFYLAGNHDMDANDRSNTQSKQTFESLIGPSYYSFNRGKVHYIVMDDVFYTGRSNSYIGYIEEKQLSWLTQDLLSVPKGSTVVLGLHIPTYSKAARKGEYGKEEINKIVNNRQALYQILSGYNVHIMSGHEHYHENYTIANGIREHVHAALCGLFWQAPLNSDGTPIGYTVYEFDGDDVSWYYKVVGKDKANSQFAAYTVGSDKNKPNSLIANVWNYDPSWKVYWYEDGTRMGEMKPYEGWDPNIVKYVEKYRSTFRYSYIGAGPTAHLFEAIPNQKNSLIEIEVEDGFQNRYRLQPQKIEY